MSLSIEISYTEDVGRVKNVQFGILSPERILKQSVCEITKSYRHQDDITSNNKYGTLHDPRMCTNDRAIKNPLSKLSKGKQVDKISPSLSNTKRKTPIVE